MAKYGTFLYGAALYGGPIEDQMSATLALLIGGTQPNRATMPFFYSGATVGDSTGVAGVKGCWSNRNFVPSELPCGVIYTKSFTQELGTNVQVERDEKGLLLLVKKVDSATDIAILNSFRDSVPAAIRAHMQLLGTANVLQAFVESGRLTHADWAGERYWAWDFSIPVTRIPILASAVA